MMNIKRYITIMLIVLSVDVSAQVTATFDSQNFVQNALQFAKQWAEMVQQGYDQATQLELELEAETRRLKEVKEEVDDIVKLTKKIIVLYKEIDNCNSKLEGIRVKLIKSNYLSTREKAIIYERACKICYNILKRKNEIDSKVDDCKTYSNNKKAMQKEAEMEDEIQMVRQISDDLDDLERMSIDLVQYKKNAIQQDYQLRKCFSLKLY